MIEYVLLVDEQDHEIGIMEKMLAHERALLHRAISVFVFNDKNEFLLQKRAAGKYHSPLLWTNTCCSHPRPGETLIDAANRRLKEEMGLSCLLTHQFSFIYKAVLENGLTEHEFDHVFFGWSNNAPVPDPAEAADWKYLSLEAVASEIAINPEAYTVWFKLLLDQIKTTGNSIQKPL
ncbi:isopentenyl-diphosphate Delta-isomerase [Pedobacter cryoconitis]|uniref:Isopentenyl-diphosphate delta-isomerase n=1 Tax=Pedobacter cryoconitis TaxID=188932 RepID=A0A7X0J0Q8_9SPHI|nr:isopentenyl-diphosphate Delta-isomerase [Pedobacter cryoconitis]MBB6498936.1 isopentenyl-diphosphate delta-isomerase [Pedobacter cryoconitis]